MKEFKGKSIYNPSGKAGEYSRWACNFYVGCSNGCEYCYCKKGLLAKAMGRDKPQLKDFKGKDPLDEFDKEVIDNVYDNRFLPGEKVKFKVSNKVVIECPHCGFHQVAIEDYTTAPFPTFVHRCSCCGYLIMESEWNVVKQDANR